MGECDGDGSVIVSPFSGEEEPQYVEEEPQCVAEEPQCVAEEHPRNSVNPPADASSFSGPHGQNIAHVDKDSVESNAGSKLRNGAFITTEASIESEFEIGRRDRVLNQEKFREMKSKNPNPHLKKKERKVIVSYKLFKSIVKKRITETRFTSRPKTSCRGTGKKREVIRFNWVNVKLVPTFKLRGPYFARRDENRDEDYSGSWES